MNVELLEADVAELAGKGIDPFAALDRGRDALGRRPTHEKLAEKPGTAEAIQELIHLYAEIAADMHLLQFAFATRASDYRHSRERYDMVEEAMAGLQRNVAPKLRARLRELRVREAQLVRLLEARGVDAATIGPIVPAGTAIDPTPRPGEIDGPRRSFPPLPPRRSIFERFRAAVGL